MRQIKAQDLRLGNLLNDITGYPVRVALIDGERGRATCWMSDGEHECLLDYPEDHLQGIPLTRDLLKKCPELGQLAHVFFSRKAGISLTWREGQQLYLVKSLTNQDPITSVQYLHDLQNLYKAITGEELVINL